MKKYASVCFLLFIYLFIFMLSGLVENDHGRLQMGLEAVKMVHTLGLIGTTTGFLAFPISRKLCAGDRNRRFLLLFTGVACTMLMLLILYAPLGNLFGLTSCLCMFFMGYLGGAVHYFVSFALIGCVYKGRIIGMAVFLATLVQYLVQRSHVELFVSAGLLCGILILMYAVIYTQKDWVFENPLPYAEHPGLTLQYGIYPILAVLLMSIIIGFNDGIITRMNATGVINLAAWPRLFHGMSCLLAGFLADIKKRSLLPIGTGFALTLSTVAFFFLTVPGGGNLNLVFLYTISGFYVIYLTLVFMDMAPYTQDPTLWRVWDESFDPPV